MNIFKNCDSEIPLMETIGMHMSWNGAQTLASPIRQQSRERLERIKDAEITLRFEKVGCNCLYGVPILKSMTEGEAK